MSAQKSQIILVVFEPRVIQLPCDLGISCSDLSLPLLYWSDVGLEFELKLPDGTWTRPPGTTCYACLIDLAVRVHQPEGSQHWGFGMAWDWVTKRAVLRGYRCPQCRRSSLRLRSVSFRMDPSPVASGRPGTGLPAGWPHCTKHLLPLEKADGPHEGMSGRPLDERE